MWRNKFLIGLIVLFPIGIMIIMPLAANLDVKNITLSIVDRDYSTYSERLTRKIDASDYFITTGIFSTFDEALKNLESGKTDMIIEIEPGFERKLIRDGKAQVMITSNAINTIKSGVGTAYLSSVLLGYANEIRGDWVQLSEMLGVPVIEISPLNRYNTYTDYKVFMVPALIVMLLACICGFLPALNIVSEKEAGTIEQLNVTPINRYAFILSKLIPYWVTGFFVLAVCILMGFILYDLKPASSIALIFFVSGLFLVAISGFGLIVSNYSDTIQQATFVAFFFIIIMIIMSGLFTPVASMPGWAQVITEFIPLTYYSEAMREVYLKGSTLPELTKPILIIIVFGVLFYIWAILSYKKTK